MKKASAQFESAFWSGHPLDGIYQEVRRSAQDPITRMFVTAMQEWEHSGTMSDAQQKQNFLDRLDRLLSNRMTTEMEKLESHTSFLATVGSSAPFVGLLGTVWGII